MRHRCRQLAIATAIWASGLPAALGQQANPGAEAAWATGGASATAKPGGNAGTPPYWQAPALPAAVIQGGTIPPGWTPQPIPYQGVGPDGRMMTQYFAPTYTFTYQSGPPVLAIPQPGAVNRRRVPVSRSPQLYGAAPAPYAAGWAAPPPAAPPIAAPAPAVARYAPPPVPTAPPAAPQAWAAAAAPAPPPTIAAPPPAGWAAAVPAAGAAAAAAATPPTMALSPVPTPAAAAPAMQPIVGPAPPAAQPSGPRPLLWRVIGVQDGDTVTCLDESNQQRKVALGGIDAPEIGQAYGKTAREALAGMVFGRTVEAADAVTDPAGGVAARLFVDGVDVSRQMVATGNAWCDPAAQDSSLATEQAQAQAAKLGLWADASPTAPWDYRAAGRQ